jgi:hypothetical protein
LYAENLAVCQWIENVQAKCSTDEICKAVAKWKAGLYEKDHLIKTTALMLTINM